jgi:hypothetical protein
VVGILAATPFCKSREELSLTAFKVVAMGWYWTKPDGRSAGTDTSLLYDNT